MSGVSRLTADRHQRILLELISKPGNEICADCKARAPRWASHNLGIFICMNCASIHRKIGTHITKVKSVTMDSWSKEQVEVMKSIGNITSNTKYNPDEARHPPPANREESERDSELEKFIRWKYEFKKFMEKPATNVPLHTNAPPARAKSTPATIARRSSPLPPIPTSPTSRRQPSRPQETYSYKAPAIAPTASHSQPPDPAVLLSSPPDPVSTRKPLAPPNPVWNDIMSLTTPSQSTPSQSYSPMPSQSHIQVPQGPFQQHSYASVGNSTNPFGVTQSTNSFSSTLINPPLSRSTSLPVPTGMGPPFQTQNAQSQSNLGNPYTQQPSGFQGQMTMTGSSFRSAPAAPMHIQSPFGQPSSSPFPHNYTPPLAFQQQQGQQQQQFAPSSFPQQYAQPLHPHAQQSLQSFPQQPHTQNPFGAQVQWQQQQPGFPGQPQYSQWGGM